MSQWDVLRRTVSIRWCLMTFVPISSPVYLPHSRLKWPDSALLKLMALHKHSSPDRPTPIKPKQIISVKKSHRGAILLLASAFLSLGEALLRHIEITEGDCKNVAGCRAECAEC